MAFSFRIVGFIRFPLSKYSAPFLLQPADQETIELVGKGLAGLLPEGRWSARHQAAVPQFAQEITHGQTVLDVLLRVELAPRVKGKGTLGDYPVRKGNIGCNYQIARLCQLRDAVIGDVRPPGDEK